MKTSMKAAQTPATPRNSQEQEGRTDARQPPMQTPSTPLGLQDWQHRRHPSINGIPQERDSYTKLRKFHRIFHALEAFNSESRKNRGERPGESTTKETSISDGDASIHDWGHDN